jgi:hypothetical protein
MAIAKDIGATNYIDDQEEGSCYSQGMNNGWIDFCQHELLLCLDITKVSLCAFTSMPTWKMKPCHSLDLADEADVCVFLGTQPSHRARPA